MGCKGTVFILTIKNLEPKPNKNAISILTKRNNRYLCTKYQFMPEISNFYGIVITMYFPEHNPPHFHVRYNEYHASIDIQTGKVTGEMPRRALKLVYEWLDMHKEELLENWYKLEKGSVPSKIQPLD